MLTSHSAQLALAGNTGLTWCGFAGWIHWLAKGYRVQWLKGVIKVIATGLQVGLERKQCPKETRN